MSAESLHQLADQDERMIQWAFAHVRDPEGQNNSETLPLSGVLVLSDLDDTPILQTKPAFVKRLSSKFGITNLNDLALLDACYYSLDFPWEKYGTTVDAALAVIRQLFSDPQTYLDFSFSEEARAAYHKLEKSGAMLAFHTGRKGHAGKNNEHHAVHAATVANLTDSGYPMVPIHSMAEALVMKPQLPMAQLNHKDTSLTNYDSIAMKIDNAKYYRDFWGYRVILVDDQLELNLKAAESGIPSVLLAQTHNFPHNGELEADEQSVKVPDNIVVISNMDCLPAAVEKLRTRVFHPSYSPSFIPVPVSLWNLPTAT